MHLLSSSPCPPWRFHVSQQTTHCQPLLMFWLCPAVLCSGGRARRAPVRTYAESDDDEEMSEDQDDGSDYCASD